MLPSVVYACTESFVVTAVRFNVINITQVHATRMVFPPKKKSLKNF